jgi:hypothetical protein
MSYAVEPPSCRIVHMEALRRRGKNVYLGCAFLQIHAGARMALGFALGVGRFRQRGRSDLIILDGGRDAEITRPNARHGRAVQRRVEDG